MRIHIIDIDQPPGIGMASMRDMDAHPTIVSTALVAKIAAEAAKKVRSEVCEVIMAVSMQQVS
ncbi:hypothetical protein [Dyella sp.]|uniref:hypothetical protein n=1 Tax=Dyella sp. TaxID=1869338 RepID=UPI002B462802|nr:hypothetical protein [Dyella sp.]